jgi:hypothetical protein
MVLFSCIVTLRYVTLRYVTVFWQQNNRKQPEADHRLTVIVCAYVCVSTGLSRNNALHFDPHTHIHVVQKSWQLIRKDNRNPVCHPYSVDT